MQSIPNIDLKESEEVRYSEKGIPVQISSNSFEDINLVFSEGQLVFTNLRVVFGNSEQRLFSLEYKNVITHGIQDSNLVCYLSNVGVPETADEESQREQEIAFLTAIEQQTKVSLTEIKGDFEVRFSFSSNPAAKIDIAFSKFLECSALHPDESIDGSSLLNQLGGAQGFAGFDFASMVTGNDIDENGNIIEGDEDEDDEEEDEEEEESEADEQEGTQQQKSNSDSSKGQQANQNNEQMDLE